ncbi:MAG: hypothetical protein ABSG49_07615 [Methanoregula sp.]|jgi:hypothetical protein|uniref:hypothetical protein n=1 Tax=Methanoregula sp. TaxID=2052170 RepID=UPI003C166AD1
MSQKQKGIEFESENDPNFKVQHIDGIVGNLNATGGRMAFYIDIPQVETNIKEGQAMPELTVNTVKRIFLIDIRMSTENYKSIAEWMKNNVDAYEKLVQSGAKPADTLTSYQ